MNVPTAGPKEANATSFLNAHVRAALRRTFSAAVLSALVAVSLSQVTQPPSSGDQSLGKYVGTYQWGPDHFVYLQMWSEFRGKNDLVTFDESGEVRTLFPVEGGGFVTGPGAAVPDPVESRVEFGRDATGRIVSLSGNAVTP